MIDAGNVSLDAINGVWAQLEADFPFLHRPVTGAARDLGPYERPGEDILPTGIRDINVNPNINRETRKYFINGRLVIVKEGQRYNGLGQKL